MNYILQAMPIRLPFLELSVKFPHMFFPMTALFSLAVPGYRKDLWNYRLTLDMERIK